MQKSLKKQVISGLAWRSGTDILQQILQVVFTIVLARLLSKGDFGLVAMALIVNRFVKSVTNISFGTAIVQSQTINNAQISAIFYIQLLINVLLTVIVFFCSSFAATFFNEPDLVNVVKALSVLIILQSLQFPNILLRKKMEFKSFSLAQIIAMIVSNVIAIIMAYLGFGLWSLVYRLVIQSVVFGILSFYLGKWRPVRPQFNNLRPLMKFGFNLMGRNIFYFFAENMIGLMTGKFLGKDVMGLFNIAYNLAIVPANKIQNILTSVLTSGFSKIQFEVKKFRDNYKVALNNTSLFFIPFMLLLSAISNDLIIVLYGDKWQGAGLFLMILSIVGGFRGLSHLVRTAIITKGKTNVVFYSAVLELIISLPIMYFSIKEYGVIGLILGYLIGALVNLIYLIVYFNKILEEQNLFFKSIKNGLIIGVVVFCAAIVFNLLEIYPSPLSLALKIVISTIVFFILLYGFEKPLLMLVFDKLKGRLK